MHKVPTKLIVDERTPLSNSNFISLLLFIVKSPFLIQDTICKINLSIIFRFTQNYAAQNVKSSKLYYIIVANVAVKLNKYINNCCC